MGDFSLARLLRLARDFGPLGVVVCRGIFLSTTGCTNVVGFLSRAGLLLDAIAFSGAERPMGVGPTLTPPTVNKGVATFCSGSATGLDPENCCRKIST